MKLLTRLDILWIVYGNPIEKIEMIDLQLFKDLGLEYLEKLNAI